MNHRLFPNQKVNIKKEKNYYVVQSLQNKSTPGSLFLFNMERNKKYSISIDVENIGKGSLGLWIGTTYNKKCLYFGNIFSGKHRNIMNVVFGSKYNRLFIGILIRNPTLKSKYIIRDINVTIYNNKINLKKEFKKVDTPKEFKKVDTPKEFKKVDNKKYIGENVLLLIKEV